MEIPFDMLLHPELLTNEQLIIVLQERQLKIPNMSMLQRDQLLELFHNFCVPFGQRKYRETVRGKMLNKTRNISPEKKVNLNTINPNKKHNISDCDRLKPPPDILSGHMKRIKLENAQFVNREMNIKRRMSIDEVTATLESPPIKKDRKLISWP